MTTTTASPASGVTPNELILAVATAAAVETTPAAVPQLGTDFTYFNRTAIHFMSVEQLDCFRCFICRRHLDKGKGRNCFIVPSTEDALFRATNASGLTSRDFDGGGAVRLP